MKKIKVLHKINSIIGGLEKYVFNNLEYINRDMFQFDLLTKNKNLIYSDEYKRYKFGIKYFSSPEGDNKKIFIKEINDILDEGYDVFHLHTSYWTGLLLEEIAMRRKVPKVIVHSHSTGIGLPAAVSSFSKNLIGKYRNTHEYYKAQFTKEHATQFCACSHLAADWLFGSQIPRDKIQIMKNGIDVDKYSFSSEIRKELRRKFQIEDCFVLGHVGRMSYEKNHEFLIATFNELYQRNKKVRLLLVGDGNLEDNVKNQVCEYGLQDAVIFLGWCDNVEGILQAIDLFLFPSKFEGLGIALIEAQAAGLKCLVSENIPNEVAITDNVEFLPLEIKMWADRIEEGSQGYERRNMANAITNAGYNIKYAVKELEKLYES